MLDRSEKVTRGWSLVHSDAQSLELMADDELLLLAAARQDDDDMQRAGQSTRSSSTWALRASVLVLGSEEHRGGSS